MAVSVIYGTSRESGVMPTLGTLAAVFSAAIAVPLLLTPLVRRMANRMGALDRRTPRKIHVREVPRLGGIAIAAGFFIAVSILLLLCGRNLDQQIDRDGARLMALLGGAIVMLALGIYDDLYSASAKTKLVVEISVAVLAWVAGLRIGHSGEALVIAPILSLFLTVGWVVGVTNAINLMDGLDGLASGIAMLALATTALCAWHFGEPMVLILSIVMVCAVAGFLRHNLHPASIFMGDSGSLLVGYVVAIASLWVSMRARTVPGAFFPVVMLGLPLLDTSLSMLRRFSRGQRIMSGDLEHVHHRVLAIAGTQTRAVLILYRVAFLFSLFSALVAFSDGAPASWLLLAIAVGLAAAFVGWLHVRRPASFLDVVAIRRRNLLVRRALVDLESELQGCTREHDVRDALRSFQDTVHDAFRPQREPPVEAKIQQL
jgi:UDP-GlcNAc:undecaprenyl-phosphate GlcNAc-1-phosphate transferase